MTDGTISQEELAELVRRSEEATSAFMRGEMDRYLALTPHARGFTLMNPFGGAPKRYEDRTESLRAAADDFRAGEANLELAEAHVWGDTVVLVMIERQHGGGRRSARPGLAVAGNSGVSSRGLRLAARTSPRRSARPDRRLGGSGGSRPSLTARLPGRRFALGRAQGRASSSQGRRRGSAARAMTATPSGSILRSWPMSQRRRRSRSRA